MFDVTDIPHRAAARTARLAALPLGIAGRATIGLGKRLGGQSAEQVNAELQKQTADQLFAVLGQLKGGAMKLGQAMSVFEAALPEKYVKPYREALTKLQEAAPPMPVATVHKVLAEQFGSNWRSRFLEFSDTAVAAASIGQVHRAVWSDGREVAVKVQYPGAGPALVADLTQLARFGWLFAKLNPGLDIKPLITELKARITEELDYRLEAQSQRQFAAGFHGDPEIFVPRVVASAPKVLVTEWVGGKALSSIIAKGSQDDRDRCGYLLATLLYSAPARVGLLHADPHPGNFRLLPDGRLGVLDFGAVARLPHGLPKPIGTLSRYALNDDAETVESGLRQEKFIRPEITINASQLLSYLTPLLESLTVERFRFTREWMRQQVARIADPRNPLSKVGRQLNLPPEYLLIYRVTMGSIGVLAQLEAEAPYRGIAERWLPGFADDDESP